MISSRASLGSVTDRSPAPPAPGASRAIPAPLTQSQADALHDATLVRRFNAGDESAFREIMERHRSRLFAVAYSRLRNRGDAEEIAQDAFVRAHRGLATFRGDSSLATWLHHIARNLALNRYWYFHRRFRHATVSLDLPVGENDTACIVDLVACPAADPTREAVTREFSELIARCMQGLAPRPREILQLSHTHAYAEIARRLGVNIGTVKSRIARARENLRVLLSATSPEFGRHAEPHSWLEPQRSAHGLAARRN